MHRSETKQVSLEDLSRNIIRPEFQRIPDPNRVQEIKDDLLLEKQKYGFIEPIGVLIIGIYNNRKYIIDGQHRFRAYCELKEPSNIIVQEWKCSSMQEMEDHFRRINRYVPVESYVLNPRSEMIKQACDKLILYIEEKYSAYFSKSENPNFPYINIQQFRNIIHLLPDYDKFTSENVTDYFENFNDSCKDKLLRSRDKQDRDRPSKADQFASKQRCRSLYINRELKELLKRRSEE
jgi:hypothetical protein